jgi:uncharacterized protein (DUF1778 family)
MLKDRKEHDMPSTRRKTQVASAKPERFTTRKPARFGARLTPEQKMLFERAAALTGRSLSDFVIGAAQEVATRAIQEIEVMTLTARDSKILIDALLNPPEPNARLRAAVREYKKTISQ